MKIPHCFQVNSVLSHLKGYAVIASSAALCLRVRRRTTRLGRDIAAITVSDASVILSEGRCGLQH